MTVSAAACEPTSTVGVELLSGLDLLAVSAALADLSPGEQAGLDTLVAHLGDPFQVLGSRRRSLCAGAASKVRFRASPPSLGYVSRCRDGWTVAGCNSFRNSVA